MEASDEGNERGFPYLIAVRRRFRADDPFFAAGNIERELLAKQVALDLTEDERYQLQKMEDADHIVHCPMVGCGARLNGLDDFEDHYHARHTSSCSVCSRVYPTSRLLSIHISEVHDSFFQAKVARGFPMYECLVEDCGTKLKSYKSRQQHLIDKHKFPTSFEFYKKTRASKHQRQKSNKKHYNVSREDKKKEMDMEIDEKTSKISQKVTYKTKEKKEMRMEVEGEVNELALGVSRLSTSETPSSVSFGHRHGRGFAILPRSLRQNVKQVSQSDAKR